MERIEEDQLVKKIMGSDMSGVRFERKVTDGMDGRCEKSVE